MPENQCLLRISYGSLLPVTVPLPLWGPLEVSFDVPSAVGLVLQLDILSAFQPDLVFARAVTGEVPLAPMLGQNEVTRAILLQAATLAPLATAVFSSLVVLPFSHPKAVVDDRAYFVAKPNGALAGHRGAGRPFMF